MNDAGYQQLYCEQTEILISLRDTGDAAFEITNNPSHVLSHRLPKLITPGGRGESTSGRRHHCLIIKPKQP